MNIDEKLVEACVNGDLPAVKKCVKQGANIHARNDWPLQCAACLGQLEIVKYLIEQGANIHVNHDAALRWPARNGNLQVVNVIRKAAGDEYKCHKCIIRSTCLKLCEDFRNGYYCKIC